MFHLDEREPVDTSQALRIARGLKSGPEQDDGHDEGNPNDSQQSQRKDDGQGQGQGRVGSGASDVESSGYQKDMEAVQVQAWVYVWTDPLNKLEAAPWR